MVSFLHTTNKLKKIIQILLTLDYFQGSLSLHRASMWRADPNTSASLKGSTSEVLRVLS